MGRAIVRQPSVFLMDEPLSNLDAKLRVQMRAEIAALQADLGITTVYVTHDQAEAMTLGHRIAVLNDGRMQQCASPRTLYERPANTFVAGFIGSPAMNLCTVPLGSNGSVSIGGEALALPEAVVASNARSARESVVVGLRPESVELGPDGLPGRVELVEEFGADSYVFCVAQVAGEETKLVARVDTRRAPARGDRVAIRPKTEEAHLFDAESGERLA
jgi:multiple sugar transport system ATP-binding protein